MPRETPATEIRTTSAARRITGIDTHAHIFDPRGPMAPGRRYAPDYAATLEDWFAHLGAAGLSHGVLIQPSFLGRDNGLIAEALGAHRGRLRGIAVISRGTGEAELARLDAAGFVGARLNLVGVMPEDYAAPEWQRFFARLAEIGWQVEIQRRAADLALIAAPILAAGVTVVIDHFGLPDHGLRPENGDHRAFLDLLARAPRLWVKLSAAYRSKMSEADCARSIDLMRTSCGGVGRFVWGSDWPHTNHETATSYLGEVARLERLIPDPGERHRILVDGPAELFRFDR